MADEVDYANEQAERFLKASLASRPSAPRLEPRGSCYFCEMDFDPVKDEKTGEEKPSPKLFCDENCAKDFERERKLRGR